MTVDLEFEAALKKAIFGVHWAMQTSEGFRIYVRADGKNNLPRQVKDGFAEEGFVPLDIGAGLRRPVTVAFDEAGVSLFGLSFKGSTVDVYVPWGDLVGLGRFDGLIISFPMHEPEPKAPEAPGGNVFSLADRRGKARAKLH